MVFIQEQQCVQNSDCEYLYFCVEQICSHKNLFPPLPQEVIGIFVMIILTGIAALAGIGGGAQLVTVMVQFFNYRQKESILLVFIPIFGGASGNFANLIQQKDNVSNKPIVNVKLAILACPMMAFGSVVGVILNKFFPEFFLIIILEYFLYQSFTKFSLLAKKDFTNESQRIKTSSQKKFQLKEIELELIETGQSQEQQFRVVSKKDDIMVTIIAIAVILITFLILFFIRGIGQRCIIRFTRCKIIATNRVLWENVLDGDSFDSVSMLCIFQAIHPLFIGFEDACRIQAKNGQVQYHSIELVETFIMLQSFKAGIMSGFGMGGGMFLVPMYTSLGLSSIQATGTSSFNIFMTSFLTMVQVLSLGMMPISNALQIMILQSFGTYFSSKLIFTSLRYYDRLSMIMYALVAFSIMAMMTLPYQFMVGWAQKGFQIREIYDFQEFC